MSVDHILKQPSSRAAYRAVGRSVNSPSSSLQVARSPEATSTAVICREQCTYRCGVGDKS